MWSQALRSERGPSTEVWPQLYRAPSEPDTWPSLPARKLTLVGRGEVTQLDLGEEGGRGEEKEDEDLQRFLNTLQSSSHVQASSGQDPRIWKDTPWRPLGVRGGVPRRGGSGEEDISVCWCILEKLGEQRGCKAPLLWIPRPSLGPSSLSPCIRPRC